MFHATTNDDQSVARDLMVRQHIESDGISCPLVLAAMRAVPREKFVPRRQRQHAYEDRPLPIGLDQTISQPYIVALMTEALGLQGHESVLEIGTGSGYAAAVLGEIARKVYTVERLPKLAGRAKRRLASLDYDNIEVVVADGSRGLPEHAPYDAIVVTAGAPVVPESLKQQLKVAGRLVIPVGNLDSQELTIVERVSEFEFRTTQIAGVRFVPLIGEEGWQ